MATLPARPIPVSSMPPIHTGTPCAAHRPHRLDVPARLDLELDPAIALVEVAADSLQKFGDRRMDADGHAAVDLLSHRPEELAEGPACGTQLGVEHRHLDGGLGHVVPVHGMKQPRHAGRHQLAAEQPGQQVMDEDVLRALYVLRRVGRLLAGDALAPTVAHVGEGAQEEDVALRLDAERRLERRHQGELDAPELDGLEPHADRLSRSARSWVLSFRSAACTLPWSCETDEAPGIATTFGLLISQASAAWDIVAWCRIEISRRPLSSRSQRLRLMKSPLNRRKFRGGCPRYFPDSRPCASGLYAITTRSFFCAHGTSSRSGSRWRRLNRTWLDSTGPPS